MFYFPFRCLASEANKKQNTIKQSSTYYAAISNIRKDPKELPNPKGRSYLSREVLVAETSEISESGILLSELSIKVQPQIWGALNKNYQQAVLPVCTAVKGKGTRQHVALVHQSKFRQLPCAG